MSFKKTRLIPYAPPSVQVQEDFVEHLNEISNNEDNVLIFYDITHLEYQVKSTKNWQRKGVKHTKILKTNSSKKRINILGALDRKLKRFSFFLTEKSCNKELICDFLGQVKKTYNRTRKQLNLVLDKATYNTAHDTQDTAYELEIELEFLPTSCPNLNIIERLWKFLKKKVVNNKYYSSFQEFEQAVINFVQNIDDYEELDSLLTLNFEIIEI